MTHKTGTILFAACYSGDEQKQERIDMAKDYIFDNGYSQETVRMRDIQNMIQVVVK